MIIQISISELALLKSHAEFFNFRALAYAEFYPHEEVGPADPMLVVRSFWQFFDKFFSREKDYHLISCLEVAEYGISWLDNQENPDIGDFKMWVIELQPRPFISLDDLETDMKLLMCFSVGEISISLD